MKKFYFLLTMVLIGTLGSFGQVTMTSRASGDWAAAATWISPNLTGTITTTIISTTVTGVGTSFTTELQIGAQLYRTDGTTLIGTVQSITNATTLVLTANAANANSGANFRARKTPASTDNAVIADGHVITISTDPTCASLVVGGGVSGDLNPGAGDNLTVTGNVIINAGGEIAPAGDNSLTINGNLLNNGTLNANNVANLMTVIFNGTNQSITGTGIFDFMDVTFTNNGTASLGVSLTAIAGNLNIDAGTTLDISTFSIGTAATTDLNMQCGATAAASIIGTGSVILGGTVTITDAGTGTLAAGISANVSLGATRTFSVANDGTAATDLNISGVISGATFGITKTGTGTMVLSGVNIYTGVTSINAGIVSVATIGDGGVAGNLGAATNAAANLVLGGGALQYTGVTASTNRNFTLTAATSSDIEIVSASETLTISGASTATTGAIDKQGAGTLVLSGSNLYTGLTTISAGTLRYGANNALAAGAITVNGGTYDIATFTDAVGTVTLTSGSITGSSGVLTGTSYAMQSGTVSAILAGTGALTKTTAGTVTLSGVNTYTGVTSINAGVLSVATIGNGGVAGNLGAATNAAANLVLGGGTLQYTGVTASTNRNYTLTGGTDSDIEIVTFTETLTISGVSTATNGTLTKLGAGTLVLSGANLYTGLTTVSAGTLQYGIASALATGAVTVNGGTFDIAGFNDAVGAVTLISGTITGTTGVLTGTSYAVQSGTVSAILAGAVTLTKTTAGTVTITRANTYSGATTLTTGTLIVTNSQAFGTTSALNLNGGVLNLSIDASINAYNTVVGGDVNIVSNLATLGAGITHALGTLSIGNATLSETVGANVNSGTAGLSFGSTTLSAATPEFDIATGANLTLGALGGNVAMRKIGGGQISLNTASARTGGTVTLVAGTMRIGIVNALGTNTVPLALDGGILDLATDAGVTAYNTTINGIATINSNRATSGAGITHTLGTLSLGAADVLNLAAGANVASGTASLVFGTTTFSASTPLFDLAIGTNLTLGALTGNSAFTKQGDGLMLLNTASARTGGLVTINTGSIRIGVANAFGTAGVPLALNAGSGLNLAINATVNAHPVTVNGDAVIISNRSSAGTGITHTLGTLSIGNSSLIVLYGDNVTDAAAGLIFGTTTFTASTPVFDVSAGGVNLTLGALTGNFAFNKIGGGRLILNTASARTSGTATLTDGTMSLGIANALGTTGVPLHLNGGTLDLAISATVNAYNTTVGADATIVSNRAAAGAGITHVLGTLSIAANTLNINQGAAVTSGTAAVQFGNLTMTGAPTLSPNTANLLMTGTATGAFKLTKSGAGTLQKTTAAWTLGSDFEITAGTYDATTQNTNILGNWINNGGSHTASGASTVNFNGSSAQGIGGSSSTTFNNLTINNAAGVSVSNNENVNGTLTMTNGILTINTGNTLTIVNGNAIAGTGFGTAKHIATLVDYGTGAQGFLRVNNMATSAYLIPSGNGTHYLPVTLTPSGSLANNTFSVSTFTGITEDGTPNGTAFTANQKNRCVDAVWTVNYNGAGTPTASPVIMRTEWPGTLEGAFFAGLNDNLIGIAHYGPAWGTCQRTTSSNNDGTGNFVSLSNITTFSPFGVGWIDPTGGVLAIKITYFNASKGNGFNTLNWQAACSSSQAIFGIERSVDGISFSTINTITASQARCAQPFNYTDNTAAPGTVYYRLKVIDVDGKASYSAIVKLTSQVKDMQLDGIAPNPVVSFAQVKINTTKKDVVSLAVLSMDGKLVYHSSVQLQAGASVINIDIANLPSGMYMIKGVFSDGQTNTLRFTKK